MIRIDGAPMEGLTGSVYRQAHALLFGGVDRYFTPFLSPTQNHCFTARELSQILPEYNQGITVVPQLMTRVPEDFLWAARELARMGYSQVNLNLGCPSSTVCAKGKGAGMLRDPQALDRFFQEIFQDTPIGVSVKTRIGVDDSSQWPVLVEIFSRYPIQELIIHPRIRKDYYSGQPDRQAFFYALEHLKMPLCYNGDLFTLEQIQEFYHSLPQDHSPVSVMLGRGLLSDPSLARRAKGGRALEKQELQEFCRILYQEYRKQIPGEKNTLFKMKELWTYMGSLFPGREKQLKQIKKAKRSEEYLAAVQALFQDWMT